MAKKNHKKTANFLSLHSFCKSTQGNVSVMAALIIGLLIVVVAGTIDISQKSSLNRELQAVVDAAALAAAREMAVSSADQTRVQSVASSYVDANWTGERATTRAELDVTKGIITVSSTAPKSLASILKKDQKDTNFYAEAVAEVSGGGNVCLIGLSDHEQGTIDLQQRARITAENCQVYSNSDNRYSMVVKDMAQVNMDFVCIAGGLRGDPLTIGGDVITSCPPITDPLRDRPHPPFDATDCVDGLLTGVRLNFGQKVTLEPGVYCGGLFVNGADVEFKPGEYIILNGPLKVQSSGNIEGDGVGFFLSGPLATINFGKQSSISLRAPRSGPMAGLLIYDAGFGGLTDTLGGDVGGRLGSQVGGVLGRLQNNTLGEVVRKNHRITSDNAGTLVGTIYIPFSDLTIDGDKPVADESEYTVIVANSFKLKNGPNLVIKTDYHLSDIPVPQGVGVQDVTIRLKR